MIKQKLKKVLKQRSNIGITLIALVITIIVLLILAGISISMLSGNNNILTKTTEAKRMTERTEAKEQAQIDIFAWISDKTSKNEDSTLNDSIIQGILNEKAYVKEAKTTSFITKKGDYEIPYSELYTSNTPVISIDEIMNSGEHIGFLNDTENMYKYENNYYKIDINNNVTRINVEKYFLIEGSDGIDLIYQVIFYDNNIDNWAELIDSQYNTLDLINGNTSVYKSEGWILKTQSGFVRPNDSIMNEGIYYWYID